MNGSLRRLSSLVSLAIVALLAAEFTARVDDRIRYGMSLGAVPNENRDLVVADSFGWHGRPYGRYKRWQLDRFGFRGPDISLIPTPGCTRVMVMGASETFGLYESDSMEYSAQLQRLLADRGCYQVVNAAIVGFSVPALTQLWNSWVSRFDAKVVVVYPSPIFYLAEHPPRYRRPPQHTARQEASRWWIPRLIDRAHDAFHYPDLIQRWRVRRVLAQYDATHAPDSLFTTVPPTRLRDFYCDLDSLVTTIRAHGAQPVLVTHATRFSDPPLAEDSTMLAAWRQFTPRATTTVLVAFESAARRAVLEVGTRRAVTVVDAAAALDGHRAWFGDFVHFTDSGAAVMARLLADSVSDLSVAAPDGAVPDATCAPGSPPVVATSHATP